MKGYLAIFLSIILDVVIIILIMNAISSQRIDSWLDRAKYAGTPQQVAEFLTNYRQALDDAGRIDEKYYSVFRYPGTYMPIYVRAVDGLIIRAEALAKQSPDDTSYQMGLVNLEKDLGDIESAAYRVWNAYTGIWLWIILVVSIILLMAASVIKMMEF